MNHRYLYTRKIHQKETIKPQENTEDALTSHHCKTLPQCGNSYGCFIVNISPFLHTKSRKIDFKSVHAGSSRCKAEIISGQKQVKSKYQDRGFTITYFHSKNESEHI